MWLNTATLYHYYDYHYYEGLLGIPRGPYIIMYSVLRTPEYSVYGYLQSPRLVSSFVKGYPLTGGKGLVDLRYITIIRIEIIFGFSFFFFFPTFFPLQIIKIFRRSKSNIHIGCEIVRTPHTDNAHWYYEKIKLIVAMECSLLPYNNIKCCMVHPTYDLTAKF